MSEGYRIQRIAGSQFSQAVAPTNKTISVQALLLGPERMVLKKGLEVLALSSRVLVAAAAPLLAQTGIPVVCGMTISLDMQIASLRFAQSVERRDALEVSIELQHVPRSSLVALLGELADVGLAVGSALSAGVAAPVGAAVTPSVPL